MKIDGAMSDACGPPPHLLVYPFSSSGHIIPLLDLTQRLLTRGVTVTVLVVPHNLPLLQPLLSRHASSLHALVLPAPDSPALTKPQHRLIAMVTSMRNHHYPALVQWFAVHPSPPVAIISDFFLGWTNQLALQLGVPRIVFSPSAAFSLSVDFSLWGGQLQKEGPRDDGKLDFEVTLRDVPNSPSFPWWQVSHFYRRFVAGDSDIEFHKNGMVANMESWGVVFNSFEKLEQVYVDHMKKKFGPDRVWAVGPLLPPTDDAAGPMDRGGSSSVPPQEVLTWLDLRKTHSVVYVCFGSRMVLTNREMNALAAALEMSGVHFIWCVGGRASNGYGTVPDGFEDRVAERGMVLRGWAPQVLILRHRAVGSFLTHCGWNSVLEGLAAGVVMLTWPMGADQYTDAKLLVDQLGVGIRAWEGEPEETVPEPVELAQVLAHSVDGNIPERRRAKELSEASAGSVAPGGSSDKDLYGFIAALNELKAKRSEIIIRSQEKPKGFSVQEEIVTLANC